MRQARYSKPAFERNCLERAEGAWWEGVIVGGLDARLVNGNRLNCCRVLQLEEAVSAPDAALTPAARKP